MFVSLNWIKEYVKIPGKVTPQELAHDLTMATVEVEEVIDQAKTFENMVVGKVVELKKHPDADKLQLAMTDIGGEVKQIVCGGENLFKGMLMAVALPGAKVKWHGEGDYVKLEKTKIRGEESFGMICASTEIGLGDIYPNEEKEILNISFCNKKPGILLSEALNLKDIILEIDNKSLTNRPDLWSHYGIARELAAIYKTDLKELETAKLSKGKSKQLKISIKSKECRRYMGVVAENIKVEPSPEWMQQKLIAAGMRPINNIVDLTNYVMLETGEPMHAFDYQNVADATIVARQANDKEVLKTLEGEDRRLDKTNLVIADGKKPQALAGIKGGADSGINSETSKIIIEAANFDPLSVRRTSTKFNFRTDASTRHEKALDIERAEIGMSRLLFLIKKILPSAKIDNVIDQGDNKTPEINIKTNKDFITSRLGQDLSVKDITKILESLGFEIKTKDQDFNIKVPHWRATGDVSIPEDIVEEVGRIFGYDNFELKPLKFETEKAVLQSEQILQKRIKTYLSQGAGLSEVYNYPWSEDRLFKLLNSTNDLVKLAFPPADDMSYLQNSLVPNLLKAVETNARFNESFGLYEIARIFNKENKEFHDNQEDKLPEQPKHLSISLYGKEEVYYKAKGIFEGLMGFLDIDNWEYDRKKSEKISYLNSSDQSSIKMGGEVIGHLGSLDLNIKNKLDIKNNKNIIVLLEIDLDKLVNLSEKIISYKSIPQFPSIERDFAFEIYYKVKWEDVKKEIIDLDKLIKNIEFLSVFDLEGKKSLAFRVELNSEEKTLTSEEAEQVEKKIIKQITNKFKADLRK